MMWKLSFVFISFLLMPGCKRSITKQDDSGLPSKIITTNCISRVLEKDSILGKVRNHASENISLSETITNYTSDLESLHFDDCPEKFRLAFREHIKAWLEIRKVSDKYPSMRGELHEIFSRLEHSEDSTEFRILVKRVWDTWAVVEENSM